MKPSDFRLCNIPIGTKVGLFGDHDYPSQWSGEKLVLGEVTKYMVVERSFYWHQPVPWDVAALVSLSASLKTMDGNSKEALIVDTLLVLHRYAKTKVKGYPFTGKYYPPWEGDITVFVYGVRLGASLAKEILYLDDWESQTNILSFGAMLTIEETPSLYTQLREKKREQKELTKAHIAGKVTAEMYEKRKAALQAEFDRIVELWQPPVYLEDE